MSRSKGILLGALLGLVGWVSPALEIGVAGSASNLFFPWDQNSATAPSVTAFSSTDYFWGGEAWVSAPIGMDGIVRLSYLRDPVLRNLVSGTVEFDRGVAKISVGPLVGLFNSTDVPFSAGLTTQVELRWPGVAYVSVHSEGGLAVGVLQMTQDPQALTELSAGFYVPNAIVSGQLSVKRFNDEVGGFLITDTATRYALLLDIFKKNVPYTVLGTVGYELRSKHYAATGESDTLGSIVLGAKISAVVARGYTVSTELQSAFYTFGMDNLLNRGPSSAAFMFSAGIGLVIDVDEINAAAAAKRSPAPSQAATPAATPAATAPPASPAQPTDSSGAAPPTPGGPESAPSTP